MQTPIRKLCGACGNFIAARPHTFTHTRTLIHLRAYAYSLLKIIKSALISAGVVMAPAHQQPAPNHCGSSLPHAHKLIDP